MVPSVLLLLLMIPMRIKGQILAQDPPVDCTMIRRENINMPSGVYIIYPNDLSPVKVYCDMDTLRGGWTVIQRRMDGTVNFLRHWIQYKNGFGNAHGEFWLGLENMHHITAHKAYELLIEMEDFDGNRIFSRYDYFRVDDEEHGYRLNIRGFRAVGDNGGKECDFHSHLPTFFRLSLAWAEGPGFSIVD